MIFSVAKYFVLHILALVVRNLCLPPPLVVCLGVYVVSRIFLPLSNLFDKLWQFPGSSQLIYNWHDTAGIFLFFLYWDMIQSEPAALDLRCVIRNLSSKLTYLSGYSQHPLDSSAGCVNLVFGGMEIGRKQNLVLWHDPKHTFFTWFQFRSEVVTHVVPSGSILAPAVYEIWWNGQ